MSDIKITALHTSGLELFEDDESFLSELDDRQLALISGGAKNLPNSLINLSKCDRIGTAFSVDYCKPRTVLTEK
jgi:hypothetical protein